VGMEYGYAFTGVGGCNGWSKLGHAKRGWVMGHHDHWQPWVPMGTGVIAGAGRGFVQTEHRTTRSSKPTRRFDVEVEMIEGDPWFYFGEGGKHVLYFSASSALKGRLLRVRRDDLLDSSRTNSFHAVEASIEYLRRIVHPKLKPYYDLPDLVEVSPCTARTLFKVAIESGRIPQSRLPSWTPAIHISEKATRSLLGTLLDNYKRISGHEGPCMSVEIKPKAGYLALSPLVDPRHRLKYQKSRFWIQQQLLARGVICKGWTCRLVQASNYSPLDLFSGDEMRIKKALSALLANPHNNLMIWDNQSLVLGHEVRKLHDADAQSILYAISLILHEENILSQLLQLQLLDVIDSDGAVLIYNHLLDICDGNESHVCEMLECTPDNLVLDVGSGCLAESPFPRPTSVALDSFLEEVESSTPETSTDEEKDATYARSQRWLSKFSAPECIFLLQNYLLSLAMSDVSILIALAPTDAAHDVAYRATQWEFKDRYQGQDHLGRLSSGSGMWVYTLKVVDCDNKPLSALRKRGMKDELIRKL
jgi:hypothetical protein